MSVLFYLGIEPSYSILILSLVMLALLGDSTGGVLNFYEDSKQKFVWLKNQGQ